MQVIDIKESGSNNTLLWAIKNGANILKEENLHGIINDELFYLVTYKDINLLELYNLSLKYRNKLRIISAEKAEIPSDKELEYLFPGEIHLGGEDSTPVSSVIKANIENFINLVLQMEADDDIIDAPMMNLILPMISRKYTIQIPVSFIDVLLSMNNDEAKSIFSLEYPNTLETIFTTPNHPVLNTLELGLLKSSEVTKYNKKFDKYLSIIKYSPLSTYKENTIYKYALLGFYKFNNLNRGEVRCNLFHMNAETLKENMKVINRTKSPLIVEFVVEMPIKYLQIIANNISEDDLKISYTSSISEIIRSGIPNADIILPKNDENSDSEEELETITKQNEQISAYSVRLTEADKTLNNSINLILDQVKEKLGDFADITSLFSTLPSLYMTKAILSFDSEKINDFMKYNDAVIQSLFKDISLVIKNLDKDIKNS